MDFFSRFPIHQPPGRIVEMEPAFHLDFFRSHFDRHKAAVRDALEPVLDHSDALAGYPIDRDGLVETLVRLQTSTMIVPAGCVWMDFWNSSQDSMEACALRIAGCTGAKTRRMN